MCTGYYRYDKGYTPPFAGSERPWQVRQNYPLDMLDFRLADLDDGVMQFSPGRVAHLQPAPAAA